MTSYLFWWITLLAVYNTFTIASCAANKQDYYQVLDVTRNAKAADIKRAFRRLAAEHHPDKNKDPGAEARFREIVEAYEVLADGHLRAVYDKNGHDGLEKLKREEGQASRQPRGNRHFDIQIEEIIAELLMLFKFAKMANGQRGQTSRPFFIFSPKDADFPFRFVEPWDLPTHRKENREKYKMGKEYPGREGARAHFRQMYSEEANGGPHQRKPNFLYQEKTNGGRRANGEEGQQRTFSKDYHTFNHSPHGRGNLHEENRRKLKTEWAFKSPPAQGSDTSKSGDYFGGNMRDFVSPRSQKNHIHYNGREKTRKATANRPNIGAYVPDSRVPTEHIKREQEKAKRAYIRDTLRKGNLHG